jgi:sortase (surface protein transpeptidase)
MSILVSGLLLGACSAADVHQRAGPIADTAVADTATQTFPMAASNHAVSPALRRYRSTRRIDRVGRPRRLRIPTIGVDSRLQLLDRNADGSVEVPLDWQVAGWFAEGPAPGERGPAVILGHVDSRTGPAVFYRLRELQPGDAIFVKHAQGRVTRFLVDRVEQFDKSRFPTQAVYFPTLKPVLRLITCGGDFDHSSGHYRDNVIAFASVAHARTFMQTDVG